MIWWDTPTDMNQEHAAKLYNVVAEPRPDLIMNNRLGGGFKGDTDTPEQTIPASGYPGRDWETCMTMSKTWATRSLRSFVWKSPTRLPR